MYLEAKRKKDPRSLDQFTKICELLHLKIILVANNLFDVYPRLYFQTCNVENTILL